ncbi:MAG: hypothetical protein AB8B87_17390 [Granulosicoccus sp.]
MAGKPVVDKQDVVSTSAWEHRARQLALLGIVLLALHLLFGITAIISVLVAHTKINSTQETVYHSHLRWQIATFWLGLAGYAMGFYVWSAYQYPYAVLAVLAWVFYRLFINVHHWRGKSEITRFL